MCIKHSIRPRECWVVNNHQKLEAPKNNEYKRLRKSPKGSIGASTCDHRWEVPRIGTVVLRTIRSAGASQPTHAADALAYELRQLAHQFLVRSIQKASPAPPGETSFCHLSNLKYKVVIFPSITPPVSI